MSSTKPNCGNEDKQARGTTRSEGIPEMFHCLPVDLSRDDSELFGEAYFATAVSPIERVEQTPPRVLSRNSLLLGEELVISARPNAPNHSHAYVPRLQPEQQGTDDGLESASSATNRLEEQLDDDNFIFTPCSPHSEEVGGTSTPPPSITLNSNTLSPPPFVSSALQAQQVSNLSVLSGCSSKLPNGSRHTLPKPISSQRQPQSLPPRAPTNAHLRMSSMSSLIIGREISSNVEKHCRAHSTGDVSLLSALTDLDYEQAVNKPMSNTSNLLSGLSSQISLAQRLHEEVPVPWENPEVRGMDINIPRSLQQPILKEDILDGDHFEEFLESKGDHSVFDTGTQDDGKKFHAFADFFDHIQSENICDYEAEAVATLRAVVESELNVGDCEQMMKDTFDGDGESTDMTKAASIAASNDTFVFDYRQDHNDCDQESSFEISRKLAALSTSITSTNQKVAPWTNSPGATTMFLSNAINFVSFSGKCIKKNGSNSRVSRNSLDKDMIPNGIATPPSDEYWEWPHEYNDHTQIYRRTVQKNGSLFRFIKDAFQSSLCLTYDDGRALIQERRREELFEHVSRAQIETFFNAFKCFVLFRIFPALVCSSTLFYVFRNPTPSKLLFFESTSSCTLSRASFSWWIIFLFCRHPTIWFLAVVSDRIVDAFFTQTRANCFKLFQHQGVLFVSFSKGFPRRLMIWSALSFLFLYGDSKLARHWLFWQNYVTMFNESNSAGSVTEHKFYRLLIVISFASGFLVTLKRLWMGLFFGRRLFSRYKERLLDCMEKKLLICEVACLVASAPQSSDFSMDSCRRYRAEHDRDEKDYSTANHEKNSGIHLRRESILEPCDSDARDYVSFQDIFDFFEGMQSLEAESSCSVMFGFASERKDSTKSLEEVYERLKRIQMVDGDLLHFETVCAVAREGNSVLRRKKVVQLNEIFRPSKDRTISTSDFTKGIETVNQEINSFSSALRKAIEIDRSFEELLNIILFLTFLTFAIALLGGVTVTFFVNLILAFVASAVILCCTGGPVVDGIIMILVWRPYDIGDRILVTKAENETDLDTPGNTWLVQDMSLFFTRVQRSKTGEVAIISNATLAKSRIINFRKSGRARVKIPLKFAINASYNKIHLFRKVVLRYVEDRPQEFVRCIDFQLTRVEHESGFLEYLIILQSRDSCQEMDQVLENKMKATRFLFEVQKKLEIAYKRNIAMPSYPEHILRDKKESVLNSKEC